MSTSEEREKRYYAAKEFDRWAIAYNNWQDAERQLRGPEKWLVVQERVVEAMLPDDRPMLGYLVVHSWPTFDSDAAAIAFIKEKALPLGWVIIRQSQLAMGKEST